MHCICAATNFFAIIAVWQAHNNRTSEALSWLWAGYVQVKSCPCRSGLPSASLQGLQQAGTCVWICTCGEGCKRVPCNAGILPSKRCWQVCKDVLGYTGHHFIVRHSTCSMAGPGLNRQHSADESLTLLQRSTTKRTDGLLNLATMSKSIVSKQARMAAHTWVRLACALQMGSIPGMS